MKMAAKAKSVGKPDEKNHYQQNNLSHLAKAIIENVNLSKCRNKLFADVNQSLLFLNKVGLLNILLLCR